MSGKLRAPTPSFALGEFPRGRDEVASKLAKLSAVEYQEGEFGGEFLPADYGIDVGKPRHRRPVSL
jgi:hypothetical protein